MQNTQTLQRGHWIPDNAKDALVAIFLFVPPDQIYGFLRGLIKDN